MTYLLDTDHLSILQQRMGPDFTRLAARIAAIDPEEMGLSIISIHEQILGCHAYINRARTSEDLVRGYALLGRLLGIAPELPIMPYDSDAATTLDGLVAARVRIGTMDLRIASIALTRGLVLLTRNARDFRQVPGLRFEDWTQ